MSFLIVFLSLSFIASASAASYVPLGTIVKNNGTKAFVCNPVLQGTNGTQKSVGGSVQKRMVQQWPTLAGQGISQTVFTLDPCALRPAHVHQHATGLLYLISGARFVVGFVTDDGTPVTNEISTGASALFPIGLVHFQQNLDCYQASFTITYNNEDPGTQVTFTSFLDLPDQVVSATLGVSSSEYTAIKSASPKGTFIPSSDPDCLARCKLAPAPAPGQVQAASVSG